VLLNLQVNDKYLHREAAPRDPTPEDRAAKKVNLWSRYPLATSAIAITFTARGLGATCDHITDEAAFGMGRGCISMEDADEPCPRIRTTGNSTGGRWPTTGAACACAATTCQENIETR
jgi:hypothetical protein